MGITKSQAPSGSDERPTAKHNYVRRFEQSIGTEHNLFCEVIRDYCFFASYIRRTLA
jgi:hypothetical protein